MLKRTRIAVAVLVLCVGGLAGCDKADNRTNSAISIPMENTGGVYTVPVSINDSLTINFIVDSGATDVSIPADVVSTLVRAGTVRDEDFLGTRMYTMANGSTVPSKTFRIRSLKVGNVVVDNVVASIGDAVSTPLLGQSFLGHFKSWSLDNENHALVLSNPDGAPQLPSSPGPVASASPPPEPSTPSNENNGIDTAPPPPPISVSSPQPPGPSRACTTCTAPLPPYAPGAVDIASAFQAAFNGNNIITMDNYHLTFVGVRLVPVSGTIFALISEGGESVHEGAVHASSGRLRITYVTRGEAGFIAMSPAIEKDIVGSGYEMPPDWKIGSTGTVPTVVVTASETGFGCTVEYTSEYLLTASGIIENKDAAKTVDDCAHK
jgi:clan AA aspartic protease (TIGR02281 family)